MALLVLAATAAALLWLLRDLPRARFERALGSRLGAVVTVGGLAIEGPKRVSINEVEVWPSAGSPVRHLVIDRVVVEGPITRMKDGHFASLALSGVRVRVDLCGGHGGTGTPAAPDLDIGEVRVEDAKVEVVCGEWSLPVAVTGTLREIGGAPHGRLELRSTPLEPLAVADGVRVAATELVADVKLGSDGEASLHAMAHGAQLLGRTELNLGDIGLELGLQPRSDDGWRLVASSPAPLLGRPMLSAAVQNTPWRIRELDLAVESLAAGNLLDAVAPVAGLRLGEADVRVSGESLDRLQVAVTLPAVEVEAAGQVLHISGAVTGDIEPMQPAPTGSLRAELKVSHDGAGRDQVEVLLPASVELQLSAAAAGRVAMDAVVRPGRLGALSAHGWVATAAPYSFVVEWSAPEQSLPQLLDAAGVTMPQGLALRGTLTASGRMEGEPVAPRGRAFLELREVGLAAGATDSWRAALPSARVQLQWDGGRLLRLDLPPSEVHASGPGGAAVDGLLGAATAVDVDHRRFEASELSAELADLGMVHATASRGVDSWQVDAEAPDLGAWLEVWPGLASRLPAGDRVTGAVRVAGELSVDPPAMTAGGRFEVHDAGWTAANLERVLEGLEGRGEVVLERANDGGATLRTRAELGGFQLLWDALYGDYSAEHVALTGHTRWHPDGDWAGAWRGAVDQVLDVELSASGTEEAVHWQGTANSGDLAALWERVARGPCAGSLGGLEELDVRGGSARVEAEGHVAADIAVELHAVAAELGLAVGEGFEVDGLHLDLPTALLWRGGRFEPATVRHGEFAVASLRMGGVQLPGSRSALTVIGDDLHLDEPLNIPVLGGVLELDGLGLRDLLSADRHLEVAVELDGLELDRLSRGLGLPRFEGRLEGHFPRLRLSPEQLSVDGASELELFGGSLVLHDISGSELLSRYPRITLAMAWDGIDLGRLTSTFDFGRISGITEGEVEHCELFQGVPVRCSAWLQSMPSKGVEQRISMKAVNNIAILGTGSGFGVLNRGIHRLIDSYAYEALGFSMKLENDHFLLRGLARRGDKELFVKGRLPLRLDVVNAEPGTTVSFRSMLERLRHLDIAAVRTEP